jgi:hypothetical protein
MLNVVSGTNHDVHQDRKKHHKPYNLPLVKGPAYRVLTGVSAVITRGYFCNLLYSHGMQV